MAGKLKGFNAKQFFIQHGEKLGLGLVVLIVLYAIGTANWIPYDGDPQTIVDAAKEAQAKYDARTITDAEKVELGLVVEEDKRPAELVKRNILNDWAAANWNLRVPLAVSPTDSKQAFKEVQRLFERHPIGKLTASTYYVLLNLGPEVPPVVEGATPADGEVTPPPTALAGSPRGNVPNLDEEFQRKTNAAGGGGATPGGNPYMSGEGPGYMSSYMTPELAYYDDYSGEMGSEGGASYAGTKLKGRGQFFVSVRGIIPLHELIRDVAEARGCDFAEAAHYFQLIDYQLERQLQNVDGTWPADDAWEAVDRETAFSLFKEVDGFDLDPVPPQLTDPAVTMPLPARITGVWGRHATHPDIESFSLSTEDMENELKYQRALLTKAQEENKLAAGALPQNQALKLGGFHDVIYDSRRLSQELLGAETSYGQEYESYSSGDESSLYGTMTLPSVQTDPKFRTLVDELSKGGDDKTIDTKLKEYIQERVTAVGNLLLFRYIDFAVEPGKTYRYRARVEIENPNRLARVQDVEAPSVIDGDTRFNAWSNITDPVSVEKSTYYFVNTIDPRSNNVKIDFFHRDPALGTIVSNAEPNPPEEDNKNIYDHLTVGLGEPIGGNMEVWELSPGGMTFAKDEVDGTKPVKEPKTPAPSPSSAFATPGDITVAPVVEVVDEDPIGYSFQTGDLLVAALDDYNLSRQEHPELKIPREQNYDLQLVDAVLVRTKDGQLNQLDSISQYPWLDYMKRTIEKQNEPFRELKQGPPVEGELGCPLGDIYMSGSGYMEGGEGGSRRSSRRTRTALRKSGSRADAGARSAPGAERP